MRYAGDGGAVCEPLGGSAIIEAAVSGGAMSVMRGAVGWGRLAVCVFVAMSGSGTEPITLRLHTFNSPKAIVNQLFLEPWAREVAASSQGRVRVNRGDRVG